MKKILTLLMVMLCLVSICGCANKRVDKSSMEKKNKTYGKILSGISADEEYSDPTKDLNSNSNINGQQNTKNSDLKNATSNYRSEWQDAFKINNMSSASDPQANQMRNSVLNAKDSISVSGIKYYVSSEHGDDENNGTSPKTAFKSLKKIGEILLKSGDAVLLERGSVFRLSSSFNLKNGITYAAYGKGRKPEVCGSSMNYADINLWQPYIQRNVWVLESNFQGDVGNIVFNFGELRCKALDYILNLHNNGEFYYDSTAGKLFLYYDKGNPGLKFKDIEISPRFVLFSIPTSGHDIKIDNIALKYSGNFAIRGIQLSNLSVTNCEISWIGGALLPDGGNRYGNAIEVGGIVNSVIKNNWIYQIFDTGITFQLNQNDVINTYFTENLFEYCGMSSFEWWQSTVSGVIDGKIENVYFTNNISRFVGYGWVYGTVRGARHIQGPFQKQDYPNMKNFVIKDNIFDLAMGGLSLWVWLTPDVNSKGYLVSDNTYYQSKTQSGIGNVYGYGDNRTAVTLYVNDQVSLEKSVAAMDTHPKLVKWLN